LVAAATYPGQATTLTGLVSHDPNPYRVVVTVTSAT
jgi:hypothetical protein